MLDNVGLYQDGIDTIGNTSQAASTHTSTFERSTSIKAPLSSHLDFNNSVWNLNRRIWGADGRPDDGNTPRSMGLSHVACAEIDNMTATPARQSSSGSTKPVTKSQSTPLSVVANPPQGMAVSDALWASPNSSMDNKRLQLPSPTKQRQSDWLHEHGRFDSENASLLAGSAPEYPYKNGRGPQTGFAAARRPPNAQVGGSEATSYFGVTTAAGAPPSRFAASTNNGVTPRYRNHGTAYNDSIERAEHHFQDHHTGSSDSTRISPTSRAFGPGIGSRSAMVSPTATRSIQPGHSNNASEQPRWTSNSAMNDLVDPFNNMYFKPRAESTEKRHINAQRQQASTAMFDPNSGFMPYLSHEGLDMSDLARSGMGPAVRINDVDSSWNLIDPESQSSYPIDWRPDFHSPYHSANATPPTGPDSIRSADGSGISSRTSHHDNALMDRKLKSLDTYQQQPYLSQNNFLPLHMSSLEMQPGSVRMNPLAAPYTTQGYSTYDGFLTSSRFPSRELEQTQVIRSPLLEEFRMNNKTNKRYELRDIFDHIVEFSGDQHGSRFIQMKLETANSDEKDQVFKEIQPNSLQLMTDVFGNYVIQKMFEHGNQSQKKVLANNMKGHVLNLSLQMYGCRVVQKALEHVLTDQQASMVRELDGPNKQIVKVIRDQNGNHVVQKAIERVPAEYIQFIVEAHKGEVVKLATHTYGCRVIQRILEHCQPLTKRIILDELHGCVAPLITDSFGNYVVQHVIQNGEPDDRRRVVAIVQQQLLIFSKHKFASNVVEKCIEFADDDQRGDVMRRLIGHTDQGQTPVLGLLRDQYGNYVIREYVPAHNGRS